MERLAIGACVKTIVVILAILSMVGPLSALCAYVLWMRRHIDGWLRSLGVSEEEWE